MLNVYGFYHNLLKSVGVSCLEFVVLNDITNP